MMKSAHTIVREFRNANNMGEDCVREAFEGTTEAEQNIHETRYLVRLEDYVVDRDAENANIINEYMRDHDLSVDTPEESLPEDLLYSLSGKDKVWAWRRYKGEV